MAVLKGNKVTSPIVLLERWIHVNEINKILIK